MKKSAILLGNFGYICGECGKGLSLQTSVEDKENAQGKEYKKYLWYLACTQENCPQVMMKVSIPGILG